MSVRLARVLVVTSVFPRGPGDGTPPFVYNLCRDLLATGCELTVLAPHSAGIPREEKMDGLRVIRFRYLWPERWQTLCYEGGMIVRLRGNPLRALQVPFLAISQWMAIRKLLRKGSYDLIHAHSLLPQGLIAALAKPKGTPLITSSHGADVFLLRARWAPLLRRAVAASAALIANSRATRDRLIELGASADRILHIPATPNYQDPDRPIHAFPRSPVLLFAGRCIPEKGIDLLVEAMPLILREVPACRLRIAGSGTLDETLRQRVAELGLAGQVEFLGWLGPDQLRDAMREATLLVAPSRMIEGQNLVVTEALSVGCPVAVTARGGMMDLVRDKETGVVIGEPDLGAIVSCVVQCLTHPELLQEVSLRGFQHFQEQYSRKRITAGTRALYRTTMENGPLT